MCMYSVTLDNIKMSIAGHNGVDSGLYSTRFCFIIGFFIFIIIISVIPCSSCILNVPVGVLTKFDFGVFVTLIIIGLRLGFVSRFRGHLVECPDFVHDGNFLSLGQFLVGISFNKIWCGLNHVKGIDLFSITIGVTVLPCVILVF